MKAALPFSGKTIFFLFFALPAFIYAALITDFTFNFFEHDFLWKAYNALTISMLDGRLNVSYEDVGPESLTYNGNVYMYYGIFPTIIRFILAPFIDLNSVPVAKLSVWVMTTIGAASIQYALLFYTRHKNENDWTNASLISLIFFSFLTWFGGAHFIIIQSANLYHEPYAAMLMVSSIYLALVWRDVFKDFENRSYKLAVYATLAALSIHTRQTIAVSLYLTTFLLITISSLDLLKNNNEKGDNNFGEIIKIFAQNAFVPLVILILGGVSLLLLNYVRFDDFLSMSKGDYGFARMGEVYTPQRCTPLVTGAGRFEFARVIPNLVYYYIGGWNLHKNWIQELGLGFVRKEVPYFQLILLWMAGTIVLFGGVLLFIKEIKHNNKLYNYSHILFFLSLVVSAIILLTYKTIALRYATDMWLPYGFTLLFTYNYFTQNSTIPFINRNFKKISTAVLLIIFSNFGYGLYLYQEYSALDKRHYLNEEGMPTEKTVELLNNPPLPGQINIEECEKIMNR